MPDKNGVSGQAVDASVSIRRYFQPLLRRWPFFLAPVILMIALVGIRDRGSLLIYEASAFVLVTEPPAEVAWLGRDNSSFRRERDLAAEIEVAQSDAVRTAVRERLTLGNDRELPKGSVSIREGVDLLVFNAEANTAEAAAELANTWAEQYIDLRRQRDLETIDEVAAGLNQAHLLAISDRANVDDRLDRANSRASNLESVTGLSVWQNQSERQAAAIRAELQQVDVRIAAQINGIDDLELLRDLVEFGDADVVSRAEVPLVPTNFSTVFSILAAGFVGGLAGVGLAMSIDFIDRRVRIEDLTQADLPVLGVIPAARSSVTPLALMRLSVAQTDSEVAAALLRLRSALRFATSELGLRSVMMTSPNYKDGKSAVVANLALLDATAGRKVALVDLHLRHPVVDQVFGLIQSIGNGDPPEVSKQNAVQIEHPSIERAGGELTVILPGQGSADPATALASSQFQTAMADLPPRFDLLLIDGPPVLPRADAAPLPSAADGVVVVVKVNRTRMSHLHTTLDSIEALGGTIVGIVAVKPRSQFANLVARLHKVRRHFFPKPEEPAGFDSTPAAMKQGTSAFLVGS